MKLKEIKSFDTLQESLVKNESGFLLLYKSGSEQSECALNNVNNVSVKTEVNFLIADVNYVRDIHEKYQVNSVPTLLQFKKDELVKIIKGCHETDFFKSLIENTLYSSVNKREKKVKRVVVYTTPTCPHCTTLKNYLKDHKIQFRDIDVSKDQNMAQAMVRKSGQQGVPQIEIDGRIVVGFNKLKIDELLEIR